MIEYSLEERPQVHHELGGVMSYALTRDLYFASKDRLIVGERPVPQELMAGAAEIKIVDEAALITQVSGETRARPK